MTAILEDDRVIVTDEKTASRLHQRGFGKPMESSLLLSLEEGLYLMEKGTIQVERDGRPLDFRAMVSALEEGAYNRYLVYRDLRDRGYIVRTGFKFGAHFRVYDRGEGLDSHSKTLVHVVTQGSSMEFPELSRAVRLAQGVKKEMVFAVVDGEGDVTYYKVERITP